MSHRKDLIKKENLDLLSALCQGLCICSFPQVEGSGTGRASVIDVTWPTKKTSAEKTLATVRERNVLRPGKFFGAKIPEGAPTSIKAT
jgi:hypothetical protein